MAAPEIHLSPPDQDDDKKGLDGDPDPDPDPDEENKQPYTKDLSSALLRLKEDNNNNNNKNNNTTQISLEINSPITYHYLTFGTTLPSPSTTFSPDDTPPPPQPDLIRFTSPFEWPESRKNFMLGLSCIATAVTAYIAGSYSAASSDMAAEWHVSEVAIVVGITTFCLGFAVAPMVLAPFSEINGRYPVFVGAGTLLFISQICCSVTHSYAGMLVARFWTGAGGSVFSTMVGGVVSDLYHAEGRNTPMALFSGAALFGTGMGPLVSGFLAENTSWRWVFWLQVITCGILITAVTLFFSETRGGIILSRKARCLNKWYEAREAAGYIGFDMPLGGSQEFESQRIRWRVKSDEERESITKMIGISVYRPFHLLLTEPVVFFFSLWVAFAWAVLYLTFGSIPLVFRTSHGFTVQQCGAVFSATCVGAILSTILSIYQDRLLARYLSSTSARGVHKPSRLWRSLDLHSPEGRLYFACVESALLPVGLFWFGWTQFPSIPWVVPAMAVACATMGIYSIYLATFNYLADSYHRYASSALAAQSFCRNILGGVFPLVTVQMFTGLTFQGAASLLGALATLLTAVPWVLVFYGPRIRARSRFAGENM